MAYRLGRLYFGEGSGERAILEEKVAPPVEGRLCRQ